MRVVNSIPKAFKRMFIILFWLLVWQLASLVVNNSILLCSPLDVLQTLIANIFAADFWLSILYTFSRILLGFIAALVLGILLGALSWRYKPFAALFTPAVQVIKSVPIVCFVVLLLIWFGSSSVSALAVFLVAFPVIYTAVAEGLDNQNAQLLEMLTVFRVPASRTLLSHYWQAVFPFLFAACRTIVGLSWKSGVAAELIGMPLGSIGENIYQAKLLLSSSDLFAWTLVVVVVSLLCEKGFLYLLRVQTTWLWNAALPKEAARRSASSRSATLSARSFTARDLSKTLDETKVINEFNAQFGAGVRYLISGSSGIGKTTLLSLIAGIITLDSGTLDSPGRISMVFQEARLFEEQSAVDNIRLVAGEQLSTHEIRDLLLRLLPSESLDKPVSQLSGGMRRCVELCRALASESDTVLLDEPFTGLDTALHIKASHLINDELGGRTLLLVSHDTKDAALLNAHILQIENAHQPRTPYPIFAKEEV